MTLNEFLSSDQFAFRVKHGMKEVMTWGSARVTARAEQKVRRATIIMIAVENGKRSGFARHTGEEKNGIRKRWMCRSGRSKSIREIPRPMFKHRDK